jgi:hypothetical protein
LYCPCCAACNILPSCTAAEEDIVLSEEGMEAPEQFEQQVVEVDDTPANKQ